MVFMITFVFSDSYFVLSLAMLQPLRYFSFQPGLHDWINKGRGMYYTVCGMVHVKDPLLLIGKSSSRSGGSGFPPLLSEWYFTTCQIKCVKCVVQ